MPAKAKSSTKAKSPGKAKSVARTKTAAKPTKKVSSKRELINTGTDKRYVRRDAQGQFKESDDVGRSLSADRRRKAKTVAGKGQGDKGDQKRPAKKK